MQGSELVINKKIEHLQYCLTQLQFVRNDFDEVDCEQLCKYISGLIADMVSMYNREALNHYRQKMEELKLVTWLKRYNIDLEV